VTEAEKDEFSTALSERYAQIKQLNSSNKELINIWDAVISDLPLDIKSKFEENRVKFQLCKGGLYVSTVDLNSFAEQPIEVQLAIAFYIGYSVNIVRATAEERQAHYAVLEQVGLLEPINP
jgi:hypothetical protein